MGILSPPPSFSRFLSGLLIVSNGRYLSLAHDDLFFILALGMNMGLHDSYNLTWKMALVLHGIAPESLLETYEAERKVWLNYRLSFGTETRRACDSADTV